MGSERIESPIASKQKIQTPINIQTNNVSLKPQSHWPLDNGIKF